MNLKSLIITSIFSGLITIATGMILFWFQAKTPELTYNSVASIPFDDVNSRLYIQQVNIQNEGNKIVENVTLSIKTFKDNIKKTKIIIDPAISFNKSLEIDCFKIEIDSLNPGENAKITLLVESNNNQNSETHISLRGKGVKGKAIGERTNRITPFIFIPLLSVYAGILSFILYNKSYRSRFLSIFKEIMQGKSHSLIGGQNYEIASILSMHGFPEKAKGYLSCTAPRQYWAEADLLSAEAIKESLEVKEKMIRVLKDLLATPLIASSSKSIVAYNITRIYKVLNKNDKVTEYLNLAKEHDQKEIELRLSKDPIFSTID